MSHVRPTEYMSHPLWSHAVISTVFDTFGHFLYPLVGHPRRHMPIGPSFRHHGLIYSCTHVQCIIHCVFNCVMSCMHHNSRIFGILGLLPSSPPSFQQQQPGNNSAHLVSIGGGCVMQSMSQSAIVVVLSHSAGDSATGVIGVILHACMRRICAHFAPADIPDRLLPTSPPPGYLRWPPHTIRTLLQAALSIFGHQGIISSSPSPRGEHANAGKWCAAPRSEAVSRHSKPCVGRKV